jgi:predicted RNA-binding Zn-ribbon protein involved in translation (DUF1610 family)
MNEYTTYKHLQYRIMLDDCPENPRHWDNVSIMAFFHGRYNLGDKTDLRTEDFSDWQEMRDYLVEEEGALHIQPVYMYDHSGLSFNIGGSQYWPHARWDSGCIGFIYTTRAQLDKMGTEDEPELIYKIFKGELEEYQAYKNGNVYGFELSTLDDEEIDSSWGYYDYDYLEKHIKKMIDDFASKAGSPVELLVDDDTAADWVCPACGTENYTEEKHTCRMCNQEIVPIQRQMTLPGV